MKKVRIISLGGGVQSCALVYMATMGLIEADEAVFCDTITEHPETYQYLHEVLIPHAESHDFPVTILSPKNPNHHEYYTDSKKGKGLYEYYWDTKAIPFRATRSCTHNWKITPFYRYLEKKHPQGGIVYLGFSTDEITRMRDSYHEKFELQYPLIDMNVSRRDLINHWYPNVFKKPVPPKSSCYVCPFMHPRRWIELKRTHPELLEKAAQLEERSIQHRKKATYIHQDGVPLRSLLVTSSVALFFTMKEEKEEGAPCGSACFT